MCIFLVGCSEPEPAGPEKTEIKVLIAYSNSDSGRFDDYPKRIRELFNETQSVFDNSKTNVNLNLVSVSPVHFTPEERLKDLERLVKKKDGYWDSIHEIRDKVEADIVVLLSPLENATVNGSVLATEATSFAIAAWEHFEAPHYGLAHEIAHLFGAMHPGTAGPVAEQLPQGFSWGNDSIKTVLDWGAGRTIPFFSGPGNIYQGIPLGEKDKSDISSVIRTTAVYISNFRGRKSQTDFVPKGTIPTVDYSE
jgi:hypothetical protein